jgi:hypothetical protein
MPKNIPIGLIAKEYNVKDFIYFKEYFKRLQNCLIDSFEAFLFDHNSLLIRLILLENDVMKMGLHAGWK